MQSICSFNVAAISHCNIMPCVNAAYGNHMEWKILVQFTKDLVDEMYANIYLEALFWLRDNIDFVVINLIAIGFAQTQQMGLVI